MRLLLATPLLFLLACATEPGEAPAPVARFATEGPALADSFDVARWLAETERVLNDTTLDYDTQRGMALNQARALDEAVGWSALCAEDDAEEGGSLAADAPWAVVDSPISSGFGLMAIEPFADGEHLVTVMCFTGAYQGAGALVHLADGVASLVRFAPEEGDDSAEAALMTGYLFAGQQPGDPPLPPRSFVIHTVYRGLGDCGARAVYRLGEDSVAHLVERREKAECEGPTETCDGEPCVDPTRWPVVYPAD